jgi:GntR family transcriptional regulator, rspAB operon transcriptional repressor
MRKSPSGKTTQTEKAYAALKRAIVQGEIEEGTFLSESQIMASYGIGRTPYREACNRLHHEGLLQVVPHHGFLVPEVSFHAVCELFEMRLILEDAAAQLATLRASDHEIQELEKLADSRVTFEKSKNALSALIEANTNFHLALARTTRNRRLFEQLRQNLESTERLMYIELRSSAFREPEFRSFHERIVEALKRRDLEAVRQAVWDDITEGQGSTLSVRNLRPPRALLGEKYIGSSVRLKRVYSASKSSDKA